MKKVRDVKPPKGLARWLFKLPNFFYAIGLGSLMGSRFIQIKHIGRNSGKVYKTIIEVVKYNVQQQKVFVVSGFKEKSDWLKNITRLPQIEVNFKGRSSHAVAKRLPQEKADEVLLDYAHRHPFAMRELAKFMGYEIDGSNKDTD